MRWFYHSTTRVFCYIACLFFTIQCKSKSGNTIDEVIHGTIAYPFMRSSPLGVNGKEEKFVIRSISQGKEYVVEIPGAGKDYDIEIPMALLGSQQSSLKPSGLPSPAKTDRELLEHLPKIERLNPSQTALLDKAFGVGGPKGPKQSPSYSMGIAKINHYYLDRKYEFALISINQLLNYYPNSPKLHKMKGTIYVKLQNYSLAEKSWLTALELTPNDKVLRRGVKRLQSRIRSAIAKNDDPFDLPKPISKNLKTDRNDSNHSAQAANAVEPQQQQQQQQQQQPKNDAASEQGTNENFNFE